MNLLPDLQVLHTDAIYVIYIDPNQFCNKTFWLMSSR